MRVPSQVHKDLGVPPENSDDSVHRAIVVQFGECDATSGYQFVRSWIYRLEAATVIQRKQRGFQIVQGWVDLLDIVQNMALRDKQILLPVIIEIFEADAPTGSHSRQHGHSGGQSAIAEDAFAIIVEHRVSL